MQATWMIAAALFSALVGVVTTLAFGHGQKFALLPGLRPRRHAGGQRRPCVQEH
ncbi:hypothetical protein [Extensimonas sp. H3M7-6]|uniref:hypothetical protein n=1 Tax=Extensimonas soli TaxID=3031322 RepID=UPI0023DC4307|nr:hypothetical protein [Extensimonas sp. H3M7-6]MDF1482749.1 hypothetical protein [Extensimonas sp. H3M7-6]